MKKLLTIILSLCLGICALIGLCSCKTISEKTDDRDTDIVAVYELYVANAKENGETPLSYEEWLQTIKGEKGEKATRAKKAIAEKTANQPIRYGWITDIRAAKPTF